MTISKPDAHFHFIDCGQGNMTLVVAPDNTVILYDCRVTEETESRIIDHLRTFIPKRDDPESDDGAKQRWIDWFICSHRDQDHIHGLDRVNKHFPIRGIVDPGMVSGSTDGDENKYYMSLRRQLREKYGEDAVIEPPPVSATALFDFGGLKFYCLCSGEDCGDDADGHYGNNVFQVEYAGNRVLLTGDSDWKAWKEKIVPTFKSKALIEATILVASHHGSRSFFTDSDDEREESEQWKDAYFAHLDLINPVVTIISVGPQEVHNHPNETALEHYKKRTRIAEQVYLSRDKETLVGRLHADGTWHLTPARFLRGWRFHRYEPSGKSLTLTCDVLDAEGDVIGSASSGDEIKVGNKLRFAVKTTGGLRADMSKVRYVFEVSNGGADEHDHHKEIYFKRKNETGEAHTFERDVSYVGTHLLRCNVYQKGGGDAHDAQTIFVVKGVP